MKHQTDRPRDWIRRSAPELRLVSDAEWAAAHRRLDAARALYLRGTHGLAFGRPADSTPAKYLLTGMSQCGECGNGLIVKSRSHGNRRAYFYACGGYHNRGTTVCSNYTEIPMEDGNGIVLEALLDEVLDKSILTDAADEALTLLKGDTPEDRVAAIERELATVEQERARLVTAIATGGDMGGLLEALRTRDDHRQRLESERAALRSQEPLRASTRLVCEGN